MSVRFASVASSRRVQLEVTDWTVCSRILRIVSGVQLARTMEM